MHYLTVLGSYQRVYPNTHCSGICKLKGLQWVFSDATAVYAHWPLKQALISD